VQITVFVFDDELGVQRLIDWSLSAKNPKPLPSGIEINLSRNDTQTQLDLSFYHFIFATRLNVLNTER
jgi:hypothetical protein